MKNLFKNEQSGRSMVEMLGVLAIIGVLSVGGISGYSKAMAKFKLTKAQDQLTMLIMNIRTAYATSPGYTGLTEIVAANYGLVPSEMIVKNNAGAAQSLLNAFGGTTTIAAVVGADGTAGGAFRISFQGVGKDACISLATSDWGADGLAGMSFNATATGQAVEYEPSDLPLTLATASAAGSCADDKNNTISWVYF